MTSEREIGRLLDRWLADGPTEVADRVIDGVAELIGHERQEPAWRVSWKDSNMTAYLKPLLAVVAVVVIAVAGIAVITGPSGPGFPGPASPSPSASPSPTPRSAIGSDLGPPGTILQVSSFSEPFTFTLPAFPSDPPTPVSGDVRETVGLGQHRQFRLAADSLWGSVTFHDDTALPADMCKPTGTSIEDVPPTAEAVGRWLGSGAGLVVSNGVELTVDGRTAVWWDVTGPHGVCDENQVMIRPAPWFAAGEHHRIYAVPTGADTILVITWGTDWSNGSEEYIDAVNAATDNLVRSMTFGR